MNRKGLPKTAKSTKLARGASVFYQKEGSNIVLTTWKDKKQVNLLSSGESFDVDANRKPISICNFNRYMGRVDLNNQLATYYRVGKPSNKWWRYIFWFAINVAVTNSWLLFKSSVTAEVLSKTATHKKYILQLANELRNNFSSRKSAGGRPRRMEPAVFAVVNGHQMIKTDVGKRVCRHCTKTRTTAKGYKKKVATKCKQCDVFLCKGQCFLRFHSPQA